jgi:hypothetical protein
MSNHEPARKWRWLAWRLLPAFCMAVAAVLPWDQPPLVDE